MSPSMQAGVQVVQYFWWQKWAKQSGRKEFRRLKWQPGVFVQVITALIFPIPFPRNLLQGKQTSLEPTPVNS